MHAKDDSEASVGSCSLATKAGACLSPKGEFAQEPEWISECSEQETQRVLAAYLTHSVRQLIFYSKNIAVLLPLFRIIF